MDEDQIRRIQQYFRLLQQQMNIDDDDEEYEIEFYEMGEDDDDEEYDVDEEEVEEMEQESEVDSDTPKENDTAKQQKTFMDDNPHFTHSVMLDSGCAPNRPDKRIMQMALNRQIGSHPSFSKKHKAHISQRFLPKTPKRLSSNDDQIFCGRFSSDGEYYMSACKDGRIRLYNTRTFKKVKEVVARDVGWSIISTDYSPDQRWFIYSSWSDYIHICNIYGDHEIHDALDMKPDTDRFCLFSTQFSPDSNEILGGSSDQHIYIYDLTRREVAFKVKAHLDDVNTACYAEDNNNNTIYSGSDDSMVKIWDRRILGENATPVGVMVGHQSGITHIASKGDGRYFISNGKDQCIKLWDLRKIQSNNENANLSNSNFDYRFHGFQRRGHRQIWEGRRQLANDASIMTYRGHQVFQTLIRAYFSPMTTTGQKYIYTGSYDGIAYVYDVLTGKVVSELKGHRATIRDVSWHPYENKLATASWDGSVMIWS